MSCPVDKAITLIKQFEGCRLKAYQDQAAIWTIGWGTTVPTLYSFLDKGSYPPIEQGAVWTQADCDRALLEAVESILGAILRVLGGHQMGLSTNEMGSLADFVYNVGIGNFERSGALKLLKQGDLPAAADALLLWNKVGSYVSQGLVRRREAERALFLLPDDPINTAL